MNTRPFGSPGLAAAGSLSGTNVKLAGLNASNGNASDRFLLLFAKAAAPQVGDVPDLALRVPGGSQLLFETTFLGGDGMIFAGGLSWAWSSVPTSYDGLATAADHTVWGAYAA